MSKKTKLLIDKELLFKRLVSEYYGIQIGPVLKETPIKFYKRPTPWPEVIGSSELIPLYDL